MKKDSTIGRQGFTILELLIVIVLITIVGLGGAGVYGQVKQNEDMASAVMQVVQVINEARSRSVTGEDDRGWKVKIETDRVKLADEMGTTEEEYVLPVKYTLSPAMEVEFDRVNGKVEACVAGCVFELKEVNGSLSYQFRLLFSGIVEY